MINYLDQFKQEYINNLSEEINLDSLITFTNEFIYQGEYINYLDKIDEIKNTLENLKSSILNEIILIDNLEVQTEIHNRFERFKFFINNLFEDCIIYFLEFVKEYSTLSYAILDKQFQFLNTNNDKLKETFELINIFLLEYYLNENVPYYSYLIESKNRLEKFHSEKPFSIYHIIDYKITFLQYKWKKRQKYIKDFIQKNIDANFSKKIILQSKEIDLSKKILIGDPHYVTFKNWIDKIELCYFNKSDILIDDYQYEIGTNNLKNDFNLYYTIKLYKDFTPSLENLKSFKNFVLTKSIDKKNQLYYLNNVFSLLTKNKNNKDEVLNLFNEIELLNNLYKSNNNFIYYKYIDYKIRNINEIEDVDELSKEIEEIEKLYFICKNRFEWTFKSYNILFNFDLDNSMVEFNNHKVYFPTSFLLTICEFENKYLINKIPERIHAIKYDLIERKNLKQNNDINELINNREKDSIQTISLFTGVIAFIMGSISGFKFIDNIYNAISFIIIYGICISIFLILIIKLIKKDKNDIQIMDFLPAFILLVFLAVFCIMTGEKNILSKDQLKTELIKYKLIKDEKKTSQN